MDIWIPPVWTVPLRYGYFVLDFVHEILYNVYAVY